MKIEIPTPQRIPKGRGVHSTSSARGSEMKTRCLKRERALVEKAAEKCGVTVSQFIRWVSVHAAEEINND